MMRTPIIRISTQAVPAVLVVLADPVVPAVLVVLADPVVYENRVLECDDVGVSGGRKPRSGVVEAFRGIAPVVTVIGDALTVSNIKRATYSGYKAAMEL